ncbi:MAG: hypothetical protein ACI85K_003041, partial [Hyphomicrobiaceae bacterium]
MQKPAIILLVVAVVALIAGAFYLPQLIGEPEAPVMHWDASDDVDGSQGEPETVDVEGADIQRTAAQITPGASGGGKVSGRVTDLDGNPVANAEITMEPDDRNPLRWQRNRAELLPPLLTDSNGDYLFPNVPVDGTAQFTVSALAKMHTPGRSSRFQVAEGQAFVVPDIQLGPGFEVTGFVRDELGRPIANADVSLRSTSARTADGTPATTSREDRRRSMRAGFGRGRNPSTKTDEKGRFFLEHLPGMFVELTSKAKGFLDYEQVGIDVKQGQLIQVAMADGLRITGIVMTPDGQPVTSYGLNAVRLRGLPDPNEPPLDLNDVMKRFREGNLDQATQDRVMKQMSSRRGQGGGRGGRGGDDSGLDKPEPHPDGKFLAGGLQEGVYDVHVQAPEFARFKSAEVEVRRGTPAPD